MRGNKRLTKSDNVVLTGSLAGVAEYFGIDPTIVRLGYLGLSLFVARFPGIILYITLAVLMPAVTNRRNNYYN